jgi:hypothetical protein
LGFSGELYGPLCFIFDIGNAFLYGKTKKKVYITAGPAFGASLFYRKLVIDEFLYGLKTCTLNNKEDIYSQVIDIVRIGFFLEELYGLSCWPCDIGNAFLYGKTK